MSISTKRLASGGALIAVLVAVTAWIGASLISSPSTDAPDNMAATGPEAVADPSVSPQSQSVSLRTGPSASITNEGISREWLEAIGATPVSSPAQVAARVNFQSRIPELLGDRNRDAIYIHKTPDFEVAYALYEDVSLIQGVFEFASRISSEEFARLYEGNTGAEAYLLHFDVSGIPAHGWDKGVFDALGEDGSPIKIANGSSQISWLQDGVILTVGSDSLTTRDLLPMAEAVARTAPAE